MFTPSNVLHITCHVTSVTCHVSHVTCHNFFIYFVLVKVLKLIGGGSVINGAYPVKFLHGWQKKTLAKGHISPQELCYRAVTFSY